MDKIDYKYNENNLLNELRAYVDSTYDQHYAQGNIQTTEFIIDCGDGIAHTRSNVIKYAQRYGKKAGRNRKDILKMLHYTLIMLYVHDLETKTQNTNDNLDIISLSGVHAQPTLSQLGEEFYATLETINITKSNTDIHYHPV